MKKLCAVVFLLTLLSLSLIAAPKVGEPAPYFAAINQAGQKVTLSDFKGKIVVLEWTNRGCPFVKKFYKQGNMQAFQRKLTKKDVVWLSILSSAPGKQGFLTADESLAYLKKVNASPTHFLLDPAGFIGTTYGARTTPHMFVIDKQGVLRYQGAIDSIASVDTSDIVNADNYVIDAVDALMRDKPIKVSQTRPYGCSVKY